MALTRLSTYTTPGTSLPRPPSPVQLYCPPSTLTIHSYRPLLPSIVHTPVPLFRSSGRVGVESGPQHRCARADGRAGRSKEMANMFGSDLRKEVLHGAKRDDQRVEIIAPTPV